MHEEYYNNRLLLMQPWLAWIKGPVCLPVGPFSKRKKDSLFHHNCCIKLNIGLLVFICCCLFFPQRQVFLNS